MIDVNILQFFERLFHRHTMEDFIFPVVTYGLGALEHVLYYMTAVINNVMHWVGTGNAKVCANVRRCPQN
jgi:hypothetical protein